MTTPDRQLTAADQEPGGPPDSRAGRGRRGRYHHGDLRAALIDTTIDLLGERGVQAFSMAEASRRLGVAVAAPYRHFADRDALLAAVAVRAGGLLGERMEREAGPGPAPQLLAAAARAYVRFAADQRPLFQALVGAGLDKTRYPEIEEAARRSIQAFMSPAATLLPGDAAAAARLASAVAATAHGHAVLLLDGAFGRGEQAAGIAAGQAAAAALALADGRARLAIPGGRAAPGEPPPAPAGRPGPDEP
ncbi:MAG TPA: helix-turn-helix domain-containing protein [Trebonia sp.]|jgi:AcrR family transcriptional regulator|nr:helix-turn-helix domain-containing protein [Trebonia sp.]